MSAAIAQRRAFMTWRRVQMLWVLFALVSAVAALHYCRERWAFGLNMTQSLPHWAFVVDHHVMPLRGEMAMFEVPDNPYYQDRPFVKIVIGLAGDTVDNRDGEIFVAGQSVGEAKPYARDGRALEAIDDQVIPAGYVFMMGTHRDSYDSRYAEIGLIRVERIVGRAFPVL
tara:strand:- start:6538 stop:7047 length:510 start_codon:yes stop_codon:yes gene_type:complete